MTTDERERSKAVCVAASSSPLLCIPAKRLSDSGIDWAVVDSENKIIAEFFSRVGTDEWRHAEGNARLFAHAHTALLAALKHMDEKDKKIEQAVSKVDGVDYREGHWRDNTTPDELRDIILGLALEIERLKKIKPMVYDIVAAAKTWVGNLNSQITIEQRMPQALSRGPASQLYDAVIALQNLEDQQETENENLSP